MSGMGRREFITLLGGAAALAGRRRRAAGGKLPTIGFLGAGVGLGFGLEGLDCCLCAEAARTRLDRGPHRLDRVPLGGGTRRALCRIAHEFVRLNTSSSRRAPQWWRLSGPRPLFRLSSRQQTNQLAAALLRAWRDRGVMLPGCQCSRPTCRKTRSNFCARSSQVCVRLGS